MMARPSDYRGEGAGLVGAGAVIVAADLGWMSTLTWCQAPTCAMATPWPLTFLFLGLGLVIWGGSRLLQSGRPARQYARASRTQ